MSWGNLKKFQDSEQSIRLAGKNAKKILILKIILCVRIRRNIDSANAHQRCFVTHAEIFCRNQLTTWTKKEKWSIRFRFVGLEKQTNKMGQSSLADCYPALKFMQKFN